ASLSRFRRLTAVLSALALLASVLAAAPLAAADDPEPDYTATFSACVGDAAESAGFEDVPAGHTNAGDIDCIAYYTITKGTGDGSTYSPSMSVTREQMALFLTRLAEVVDIDVAADPPDAGFTDIGELSAESQTAINQLADLNITKGNNLAGTTYGPGDAVTRGQMALFIARLMDEMVPMADGDTAYGTIPEDVDDDDMDDDDDSNDKVVKSPFTDLDDVTKEAYDAITALWELGVASGISATSYGPGAPIIRAAMAEFMAGVLDHSNARPAGVTIQASKTADFGDIGGADNPSTVAVSYRDDMFMPMVDVSIKIFDSDTVGPFNEDGGCTPAEVCAWTDDESLTDASGNIYEPGNVDNGKTNTYYAWMGDADADENNFDVDTSPHATVTLSSTTDAVNLKVTTDINENSTNKNTVDIDATSSVTLTVQLVDADGEPVAKPGVEIGIKVEQGDKELYPPPAAMKTDDDGQVTYTTSGPKSTEGAVDKDRLDKITFSSADIDGDADNDTASATYDGAPATGEETAAFSDNGETVIATIFWTDSNPTLLPSGPTDTVGDGSGTQISRSAKGSGKGSTDPYVFLSGQDKVTIRTSVSFYDQYGNPAGKGENVKITIGDDTVEANVNTRTVRGRGMASWSHTLTGSLGGSVPVTYTLRNAADDTDVTDPEVGDGAVIAVRHADDDSTVAVANGQISEVYDKEDRFRIGGALYSYDDGDTFINGLTGDNAPAAGEDKRITLEKFEELIKRGDTSAGVVEIVFYDDDGISIFRVTTPGT
ncbi:MAG: hypothetical protein F4X75_00005, partial [Gemmatimonadetes bacterium]|nr:hypothetical protein [Gemmatimonadota bacterium]